MRMETSLSQRQELRLRLAPQILQSIEILQLATLDLKGLIEREMEMNPTIEIQNEDPLREVAAEAPGNTETDGMDLVPTKESLDAEFERLEGLNEQWKEFAGTYRPRAGGGEKDKKLEAMQNTAAQSESLQEVLDRQISMLNLRERDQVICSYLIWNIDENGYLRIVGRSKDMLIRGGENIYPREIEEFLYTHPKVEQAEVVGVPDPKFGEEVAAWIKLHEGVSISEEEIREFCKGKLAHFKIPRYIRFVDAFPMTVTGKVQKFVIREQMAEELEARKAS